MPDTGSMRGAFRRPFTEQIAFFRNKLGNLVPTRRWDDMLREAHDSGFMVAGAVEADLLSDLAAAVDKSIAEGGTLQEFERDFRDIVRRNGWSGWTGQGTKRGEAWRMRTIYRANMRTSYAAGRYAQLVAGNFKYWVYFHGGSQEPRIEHLGWNGIALSPDHPFWKTHYPPSDWGCSCYVSGTNTEAGIRRLGGDPDKRLPADWQQRDPATGAPVGIGRGWDYAPGASVAHIVNALSQKLETLDLPIAVALSRQWLASTAFEHWVEQPVGNWPLAILSKSDAGAIASKVRTAKLSADTLEKQRSRYPEIVWQDYRLAQDIVDAPTYRVRDGERSMVFIRVETTGETGGHVLVVKTTTTGQGLFVTSMRRLSRNEARRDEEIRRLLGRALD